MPALVDLKAPDPSPEELARAALADAITRHEVSLSRIAAAKLAADNVWDRKVAARAALESAEQNLAAAQELLANPHAESRGPTVREARQKLEDAQDIFAAASHWETISADSEHAAASAALLTERALENCIAAVVAPAACQVLANCVMATNARAVLLAVVAHLNSKNCLPQGARGWDTVPGDFNVTAVTAPWTEALRALRTDAYAPLPG